MINREPSLNLALWPRAGCLLATTAPLPGGRLVLAVFVRVLWATAFVLLAFQAEAGVVFTSLHSFATFPNGASPAAGLVLGNDGNFYGTTLSGGASNVGTVFKITTNGALTSLYSFSGGVDGGAPWGLLQGSDGSFYGTTAVGGTNNDGTVFKINSNGVLTSLYSFTGGYDGANPKAVLAQGSDNNFYGTTFQGGTSLAGTVFKITTNGALTSLYSFTGGNDGANPEAGLVQGSDGNFYGTTYTGAMNNAGTVFKITTNGELTSLHSFTGADDGANPEAGLVQGSDRNFYGTTAIGGTNIHGTVFKITTNGELTSLHSFTGGADGAYPQTGLAQGGDGSFYGTTSQGGTNLVGGTVFKITSAGALTSLHSLGFVPDGANPEAALTLGSDGNFYGTTYTGGTNNIGTVFEISPNGAFANLYSFTRVNDGENPQVGLAEGSDGDFYGTTVYGGGTNGFGTVFKITADGVLTSLYSFTGGNDGAYPYAGLVHGSDDNFYGTTAYGGTNYFGTVFKISATGTPTSLYSFTGGTDGEHPQGGLAQGSEGSFYGTTVGGGTNDATVFKISSDGMLTSLYTFTRGGIDGSEPLTPLVQGSDGNFYGTTPVGGTNGFGTVFKITTNGVLTSLHSFTGGIDGFEPQAGLAQGSDGNFYGTTYGGGTFGLAAQYSKPPVTERSPVCIPSLAALTDLSLWEVWCRAATAISMARQSPAAQMAVATCSRSALVER